MRIYSKQWCDLYNLEIKPNYDIEVIAESMVAGTYRPIKCDGFGFHAIGKTREGIVELYIKNTIGIISPPSLNSADWITLDNMLQKERNEIQNNGN
ncbi:MAG: hypothetical protein RLZZ196_1366 [Bacteroidota bacterium]|jgi:hypothetical protein